MVCKSEEDQEQKQEAKEDEEVLKMIHVKRKPSGTETDSDKELGSHVVSTELASGDEQASPIRVPKPLFPLKVKMEPVINESSQLDDEVNQETVAEDKESLSEVDGKFSQPDEDVETDEHREMVGRIDAKENADFNKASTKHTPNPHPLCKKSTQFTPNLQNMLYTNNKTKIITAPRGPFPTHLCLLTKYICFNL